MVFSSQLFLTVFLPLTVVLYWLLPKKAKNILLLLFSLVFYAWGEPTHIFVMLITTAYIWVFGLLVDRAKKKHMPGAAKLFLVLTLVLSLGTLVFFKYTGFVEPDEVFNAKGIYTLDDLKAFAEKWYGTVEKGNYNSPKNALYKFVSYHFVPRELAYNDIIFHDIEYTTRYSGSFNSEELMIPGFDRYDYFETMQGPLMKVTKPLSTAQGIDVFINYSKREIPFNPNMRHHVNVRIIPPTEFSNMKKEYADFNPTALNGILHPIDKFSFTTRMKWWVTY